MTYCFLESSLTYGVSRSKSARVYVRDGDSVMGIRLACFATPDERAHITGF